MTDVLLDDTGDLYYKDGLIDTVDGDEEILQRVWIAMNTGLGEWAFDTAFGFPYKQFTSTRGVPELLIEAATRAVVEPITGDGSIRDIEILHDPVLKELTVTVDTIYGAVTVSF